MDYSFVTLCVGGPALVYYVSPTEEELFKVWLMIEFASRIDYDWHAAAL